jgi:hypothetical protein
MRAVRERAQLLGALTFHGGSRHSSAIDRVLQAPRNGLVYTCILNETIGGGAWLVA